MSQLFIQQYLNDLADPRRVSGAARESIAKVIDLLTRLTRVSVETVAIVEAMRGTWR